MALKLKFPHRCGNRKISRRRKREKNRIWTAWAWNTLSMRWIRKQYQHVTVRSMIFHVPRTVTSRCRSTYCGHSFSWRCVQSNVRMRSWQMSIKRLSGGRCGSKSNHCPSFPRYVNILTHWDGKLRNVWKLTVNSSYILFRPFTSERNVPYKCLHVCGRHIHAYTGTGSIFYPMVLPQKKWCRTSVQIRSLHFKWKDRFVGGIVSLYKVPLPAYWPLSIKKQTSP